MKVTVQQIMDALPVLEQLTLKPVMDVDTSLAFHLARVYRKVKPEYEVATMRLQNLLAELGTEKTVTGQERLDPRKNDEFLERRAKILDAETKVNLKPDEFDLSELVPLGLTINQLSALEWLITDDDEGEGQNVV